jgi:hypothetical protein
MNFFIINDGYFMCNIWVLHEILKNLTKILCFKFASIVKVYSTIYFLSISHHNGKTIAEGIAYIKPIMM